MRSGSSSGESVGSDAFPPPDFRPSHTESIGKAPGLMTGSNLSLRLMVAGVGIPLGFALVWAGGWVLAGVIAVLAVGAAHEVLGMARARGVEPFAWIALPGTLLLVLGAAWFGSYGAWAGPALGLALTAAGLSLILAIFRRGADGNPLAVVGTTLLAMVYVALPFSFAVFLRDYPGLASGAPGWTGTFLLVFPLLVSWVGDSMAYFGGRAWGRRKLIPSVSPAKTVEGALAGLVGAMAAAAAFTALALEPMGGGLLLSIGAATLLGLMVGAVAQVGDLAESLLKREAGIKDSGRILPGHGGIMDRFDAILFTLPLTYAALPLFLGWGGG